jgi:ABC-type transport system involved in cytochrome c biogenesis permease subunit
MRENMANSSANRSDPHSWLYRILAPLGSLRLTVVLFVMSIFIVFVGTLAQTEKDIWQVVHDYFRMDLSSLSAAIQTAFAWIELKIFFPPSFFPNLDTSDWRAGFPFPNGWLIGLVLVMNLAAAHLMRFRIQAKGRQLWLGLAVLGLGMFITAVVIASGSDQSAERLKLFIDWPSLRILWLLTQCSLASFVLLIGCAMVFHKRLGIVLLHAGVAVLMFGELLVGVAAVEGQMQIIEGQNVNYVLDSRNLELAIIDVSDEDSDHVVAIPMDLLKRKQVASHTDLPWDVELVEFMVNSRREPVTTGEQNLATAGTGLRERAVPTTPISGTDRSGKMNLPAAYVRFIPPDSSTDQDAVFLVSLDRWMMQQPERLQVGGRTYEVWLRYRHMYKPYSLQLIDVRKDDYMGTRTPRNYSSELRLVDKDRNVDRRVKIWMNNPLRYAGETFYQSSYGFDRASQREYTGLQVVTNTGWKVPYMACAMVSWGMLAQFWLVLTRFLKRRQSANQNESVQPEPQQPQTPARERGKGRAAKRGNKAKAPPTPSTSNSAFDWVFPVLVLLLCGGWFGSKMILPKAGPNEMDLVAAGRIPVMYEGRVKPLDTLARNALRIVSDRQTYEDRKGNRQPAIRWLLDVITDSESAAEHRVFRIHNLDVLETLQLKRRKGFRYALAEFRDNLEAFDEQVQRARQTPSNELDLYGKKILELNRKLDQYSLLREAFRLPRLSAETMSEDLAREEARRRQLSAFSLPLAVPPLRGDAQDQPPAGDEEWSSDQLGSGNASGSASTEETERDDKSTESRPWQAYTHALFDAMARRMVGQEPNPATLGLARIFAAYESGTDPKKFNAAVRQYHDFLEENPPAEWQERKTDFEVFFNYSAPIYYAMLLYFVAFVLASLSWLGWSRPLNRAAFALIIFTLVIHTFGLIARMYISGRPPVTNLYSSAIFLGWGGVLFGLLLERMSKIGVGNVIAAVSGFTALLIGFLLTTAVPSFKGDTFTVLQAVLDTQFWLATHVTCITLGYATTFVGGLLGIVYVLRGVLTPSLSPEVGKTISRMIYGTICFAIFFSFVGTVLGGLWADDSWGRFWGWDPKENGALIIVLWNAVVLHALWGRLVRDRGLAVLAIVGNIVTAWSWFGVNELGVGLHSYGFTEGVLRVLGLFVLSQLALIAIGLIPHSWWWSHKRFGPTS